MAEDRAPEFQAAPGRDVFISYASQDKAVAESVCKALESAGLVCWIAPRDVVPGESFAGAIVHAIDATQVIVLVLSQHSAASQHVLREVERASSERHPVIAFRIDLAPMPADFQYFLNTSQWLDASAIGVKHALPKLVDAVKSALAQPSTGAHVNAGASATAKTNPRRRALVATAVIISAASQFSWRQVLAFRSRASRVFSIKGGSADARRRASRDRTSSRTVDRGSTLRRYEREARSGILLATDCRRNSSTC